MRLAPPTSAPSTSGTAKISAAFEAEIFAVSDVDGALVGGASLKAADFLPIVAAAPLSPSLEGRGRAR